MKVFKIMDDLDNFFISAKTKEGAIKHLNSKD
jgi:hypothetical protein